MADLISQCHTRGGSAVLDNCDQLLAAPTLGICGDAGAVVRHLGILATTTEGAALCFRVFCQQAPLSWAPMSTPM